MLIPIDSDVVIPNDDTRFIRDDTIWGALAGKSVQVDVDIYELEDILSALNQYNEGKCVIVCHKGLSITKLL